MASLARTPAYLLLMAGNTAAALGSRTVIFALPLLVMAATGAPLVAGITGACSSVGFILGGVLFGPLIDAYDRRNVLLATGAVAALVAGTATTATALSVSYLATVLAGSALILGALSSVVGPADVAVFRRILTKSQFPGAVASLQVRNATISIVGAPLGGALIAVGAPVPLATAALLFLLAAAAIIPLRVPPHPSRHTETTHQQDSAPSRLRTFTAGWSHLFTDKTMRTLFSVATLVNLCITTTIFILTFSLQRQGVATAIIGLMEASVGVSMLFGSFMSLWIVRRVPTGKLFCLTTGTFAASAIVIYWSPSVWVAIVALGTSAIFVPALNASAVTLITLRTPDVIVGRVTSAAMTTSTALGAAAPLLAGVLVARQSSGFAILSVVVAASCLTIASLAIPSIRRADHTSTDTAGEEHDASTDDEPTDPESARPPHASADRG